MDEGIDREVKFHLTNSGLVLDCLKNSYFWNMVDDLL